MRIFLRCCATVVLATISLLLKAQSNQTVNSGELTTAENFQPGCVFNWVNDKPGIGLPASGTGDIASFIAINNTGAQITATIKATSVSAGFAYIGGYTWSTVDVIDLTSYSGIATIDVAPGPFGVIATPDGTRVYAICSYSRVSEISTEFHSVMSTFGVGSGGGLYSGVISADSKLLYISDLDSIYVIDINNASGVSGNVTIARILDERNPSELCISPNGKWLYAADNNFTETPGGDGVTVVNAVTNTVAAIIPTGANSAPDGIVINGTGSRVYSVNNGNGTVSVINTANNTIIKNISVGTTGIHGAVVSADDSRLYVTSPNGLIVINTLTNTVEQTLSQAGACNGVSFSSDGKKICVMSAQNGGKVLDASTYQLLVGNLDGGYNSYTFSKFVSSGVSCPPVSFTIKVNAAVPLPAISAAGQLSGVNTVYGTPSQSSSFTISGANMKEGIKVTPPAGIEVSTDGINFTGTLTTGAAGEIPNTTIYVRLVKNAPVGSYQGAIELTGSTASTISFALPVCTVSPAPLTVTVNSQTKDYGTVVNTILSPSDITITGLQNSEIIGTVKIAFGEGSAAGAAAGRYPGSVTIAALTGGTFNPENYTITKIAGDIIVNKVPLSIVADNKTRLYKTPNPVFTVTYTDFVNGEGPAQLTTLPVISTPALYESSPGSYPIVVAGAAAANYNITYIQGTFTIEVSNPALTIPNTFTPNGDGINDTWNIVNIDNYPNCIVNIFNRYGQKVYSSTGYGKSWDGTYKGADLPVSTYYYVINLKNGGKPYAGSITIIR